MNAQERRVDPEDGNAYTREEFIDAYGGTVEWDAAGARLMQEAQQRAMQQQQQQQAQLQVQMARMALDAGNVGAEERRVDPEDGQAYTRAEFIDAYGGTAEWDAAGARSQLPTGAASAAAAAAAAPPLTRAEQIQAKKAEQRARVAAFAQKKKDAEAAKAAEIAAAEAQRVAAAQAAAAAQAERQRAEAERQRAAAAAAQAAAQEAEAERARQEAQAASFAASGAKAEELRRRAAQRRKASMAQDALSAVSSGLSPTASNVAAADPFAFAVNAPPQPAVHAAPSPAPAAGYSSPAFAGLGSAGGAMGGGAAQPPAAPGGTYRVSIAKSPQGFGIRLNDTPAGDAFVEGFNHDLAQRAGVRQGSIFVSVAGVPVLGRGQRGVIMVLQHPQYGANPALREVPFEFKLPSNQI